MDQQEQQEATTAAAYDLGQDALLSPRDRIHVFIASLPVLDKMALQGLDLEEPCPICLVSLSALLAHGEVREEVGSCEDEDNQLLGVTKLIGCGHVFCRRDLTEWIRSQHGSCPTCRHVFLDIRPPSESDDESSDGGEYVPNPEDLEDEDEDAFLDADAFTDTEEFPVEGMDLDFDEFWSEEGDAMALGVEWGERQIYPGSDGEEEEEEYDAPAEWGLTDGESESMSSSDAGDMSMEEAMDAAREVPDREVSVSAHEDEAPQFEQDKGLSVHTDGVLAIVQEDK